MCTVDQRKKRRGQWTERRNAPVSNNALGASFVMIPSGAVEWADWRKPCACCVAPPSHLESISNREGICGGTGVTPPRKSFSPVSKTFTTGNQRSGFSRTRSTSTRCAPWLPLSTPQHNFCCSAATSSSPPLPAPVSAFLGNSATLGWSRAVQVLPARVTDQMLSLFAAAKWGKGWRAKVFPAGVRGKTWGARSSSRIPSIDKVPEM